MFMLTISLVFLLVLYITVNPKENAKSIWNLEKFFLKQYQWLYETFIHQEVNGKHRQIHGIHRQMQLQFGEISH